MAMMTSTEKVIYNSTVTRVRHFQKNKFDKYVILEYVDDMIKKVREKESDELLRALFDIRQHVVLGKEIQKEMEK